MIKTWEEFKQRCGSDTTTNIQLVQMAKVLKISNFYYVMRDEIKLLLKAYDSQTTWSTDKRPLYVITNIHTSKEKRVHPSCFYKGPHGSYFFNRMDYHQSK